MASPQPIKKHNKSRPIKMLRLYLTASDVEQNLILFTYQPEGKIDCYNSTNVKQIDVWHEQCDVKWTCSFSFRHFLV
jgi:hypothetical protein